MTGTLDVTPNHSIVEKVNGKTLAVFHVYDVWHATDNTCMHWAGPLGEGSLVGSAIMCPGMVSNSM